MKAYSRYIIKSLIIPICVITLTLTMVVWLTQSIRFIELIINRGLGFSTFLYLSLLMMPSLISIILPIALFITILYVYNKMIMSSELIVLEGAGLSKLALAKPAFIIGGSITLIGYFLTLYLLPASFREFKDMQAFIRDNYASVLLQEEVFNSPTPGLTVYIQERDENGMLKGIFVHDDRTLGKPVTMMAQVGKLIQTPTGLTFDLQFGNRQEIDQQQGQLSLLYFDHYSLDLSMFTKSKMNRWREPQERYLNELFTPDKEHPNMSGKLEAEGHQRLTWPLFNLTLTLLALIAMFSGTFNRRGQWKRMLLATCIAVALIIFSIGLNNIIANNPEFSILVYMNVAASLLLGTLLFFYCQKRRRKNPR
jgi:lipopolysaccharide export system permease protein